MNIAVNKVPPSPNKLNGANALRLFSEQRGNKTSTDIKTMTFGRCEINAGKLKV
jgi:hypothetical protein